MSSSMGPTQAAIPFKKRALRPWKPAFPTEEAAHQADIHTELLPPWEGDNRITIGGFFQPNHLLTAKAREFSQKIYSEITQLQLTQAQEEATQARLECEAEATARRTAEEKVSTALHQVQEAAERVKQAEDSLQQMNHIKSELEQQLHTKSSEVVDILQALQTEQQAKTQEIEFRKQIQQELQSSVEKIVMLQESREQMLLVQKQLLEEKTALKEETLSLNQHLNKLNTVIEGERALRKLLEEHRNF